MILPGRLAPPVAKGLPSSTSCLEKAASSAHAQYSALHKKYNGEGALLARVPVGRTR
jgi:hypothetical protein